MALCQRSLWQVNNNPLLEESDGVWRQWRRRRRLYRSGHQAALDVNPSATSTQQNQQHGFPSVDSYPLNFLSTALEDHDHRIVINHNFGDPFSTIRDPLLHELNVAANSTTYFGSNPNSAIDNNNKKNKIFEEELRSGGTSNIFSWIQISPNSNKLAAAMVPCDSSPPMMAAGTGV
ncbi:hypothetical protein COLO4_33162 [Corchorus olitorius]|uniref:Uncharacterized protein n=1 Tax=Corchorus olitorius TaxID=93759 RepID=A0A1R3GW34_9ROSI|nr:hypothetical protein COLO4_33162 [Corchorus olitorius]